MNAFTIGLLVSLAAVLLVAAITKFRINDRPMSVAEKAEYLSKRRARMLRHWPSSSSRSRRASFPRCPAGSMLGRESKDQRWLSCRHHALGLATKGFWLEPKDVRDLVDDENTCANRNEAMRWGFLFAMAAGIGVYILTMFDIVTGREATHIIMCSVSPRPSCAGDLERRAHRNA